MRLKEKIVTFVTYIAVILAFAFGTNVYAAINCNGSGGSYGSGDGGSSLHNVSSFDAYLIETYVIEGAGYFLDANSAFQHLLQIVELKDIQGLDMQKYGDTLRNTIVSMENAMATYDLLIQAAENTPYNPEVQARLEAFDYVSFGAEEGFIIAIYKKVVDFLKAGNITGVFKENRSNFESIHEQLSLIERLFLMGRVAESGVFRIVNENLSRISLFGSYVARVFDNLYK